MGRWNANRPTILVDARAQRLFVFVKLVEFVELAVRDLYQLSGVIKRL